MKLWKKIAIILIGLFCMYNLVWSVYVLKVYGSFKESIGYPFYYGLDCSKLEDDYTYSVNAPYYLSFVGNLSVSQSITVEEDGSSNDNITLIIWPVFPSGYEYGYMINYNVYDQETEEYRTENISFELDENLDFVNGAAPEEEQLLEKYRSEIETVQKLAVDKWKIDIHKGKD